MSLAPPFQALTVHPIFAAVEQVQIVRATQHHWVAADGHRYRRRDGRLSGGSFSTPVLVLPGDPRWPAARRRHLLRQAEALASRSWNLTSRELASREHHLRRLDQMRQAVALMEQGLAEDPEPEG